MSMITVTATVLRPAQFPGNLTGSLRSIDPYGSGSTFDRPIIVRLDARPSAAEVASLLAPVAGAMVEHMTSEPDAALGYHGYNVKVDHGTVTVIEFDFDGPVVDGE